MDLSTAYIGTTLLFDLYHHLRTEAYFGFVPLMSEPGSTSAGFRRKRSIRTHYIHHRNRADKLLSQKSSYRDHIHRTDFQNKKNRRNTCSQSIKAGAIQKYWNQDWEPQSKTLPESERRTSLLSFTSLYCVLSRVLTTCHFSACFTSLWTYISIYDSILHVKSSQSAYIFWYWSLEVHTFTRAYICTHTMARIRRWNLIRRGGSMFC